MALTLAEGNKYSRTELQALVIDRLSKETEVLRRLQFKSVLGNSLTYDTWTTEAGADFYNVGDPWSESTAVLSQDTVALTILGGDVDIDNFIKATRSNIIDVRAELLKQKIQAVRRKFMDTFWYGSGAAPEFKGMHGLVVSTAYNTVHAGGGTGTALSMLKLKQAIDLVSNNNKPAGIFSSKAMRRGVEVYLDSIAIAFPATRNEWGEVVQMYRGIPWFADEHISDKETADSGAYLAKTGGANTSIFVVTFSETACCGVQGVNGVETKELGDLQTKDAERIRIRWYCALMFQDLRSCAKVDGVITAGTVTA